MVSGLKDKIARIQSGELRAVDNVKSFLNGIKKNDKRINAFIAVNDKAVAEAQDVDKKIKKGTAGKLAGLAIAVKSNISVTDLPVTCASKTLADYSGTFDADVIAKIKAEGGVIIGMVNMDEFACGVSGESSAFGETQNPAALGRVPGGSSSGSAAAVTAGMCDLALGSDTGGSIRNPASHCGIVGVKPSYGRVSRYGLVDLSMSLDQIGPLSRDVYGAALLMEVIAGSSKYDATTSSKDVPSYTQFLKKRVKGLKIGMSPEFEELCDDKRIYKLVEGKTREFASATKSTVKQIKLHHVDLAIQTYYPIVYVEFYSATRKFDGRKYGKKIEEVCKEEVLRRIIGGKEISKAEYHGTYYRKALKTKKLIADGFEKAFKEVDMIVAPTTPRLPHKLGTKITDPRVMYAYDAYTIPANLAGICAGVVPIGRIDDVPVGLQIFAPAFREAQLLNVLAMVEKAS